MAGGPDINALVDLDVAGWTACRRSRVEDSDGELVVAAPLVDGDDHDPPIGSPVTVTWTGQGGPMELVTSLAAKEERAIHMWRLRPEGGVVITQRREHVRVATLLSVVLRNDDRRFSGYLLDLSEGGLRAACREPIPLALGDRVGASLDFDGQTIEVTAEVVRLDRGGERTSAGLRFLGVPPRQADAIRGFVFARQRRERANR